jgi:uncharacterized protein YcnI
VPYESHGKTIADQARRGALDGQQRSRLAAHDWYDEFVLRANLPAEPGELWFDVRQVCGKGEWRWAERPPRPRPSPARQR